MGKTKKFGFKKLATAIIAIIMTSMVVSSSVSTEVIAKELTDSTNDEFYYSHPLTNVKNAWANGITGKGVKIAVIDSGINLQNSDLRVAGGVSFVKESPSSYTDENGHGTHVAGIIGARNNGIGSTGVAYDAQIYAVKVSGKFNHSNIADIAKGIQWAVDQNMDIINISIALTIDSNQIRSAIANAEKKGILVVAGVGNEAGTVGYPAKYSNVIGVGAIDRTKTLAWFSNVGSEVDLVAPGVDIPSTRGKQFAIASGTSQAAPYVTGMLALYKQMYPKLSVKELKDLLYKNALDLGVKGKDTKYGYGLVQFPKIDSGKEEEPLTEKPVTEKPQPKPPEKPKPVEKPKQNIINLNDIVALNTDTKHFGWKGTEGAKRYQLSVERITDTNSFENLGNKLIGDTKYDLKRLALQNNHHYKLTITPHLNGEYDVSKAITVKVSIENKNYSMEWYE